MDRQDHTNDIVPHSGRVAIYGRSAAAARTQTAPLQINEMVELAHELGYPNEQIILYVESGVPAQNPLARGSALSDLMDAITQVEQGLEQDRIHSVFVSSPYRLFRDPVSVDIAAFLRTCAECNVSIVTPDRTYDLTDPAQIALLWRHYEAAHQYITAQIKRLNAGKRRKRREGEQGGTREE